MTLLHPSEPRSKDLEIDQALRELLEPAAKPQLRSGFDRRLKRAVAADVENRRQSRLLRRALWAYWMGVAAVSATILWQFQDRLLSGPALWVSVGTLATLAGAGLSLWLLAALPIKRHRRSLAAR